jgi:hypothetical protein
MHGEHKSGNAALMNVEQGSGIAARMYVEKGKTNGKKTGLLHSCM